MMYLKQIFIRLFIILFWLLCIGSFLYLSYFLPIKSSQKSINVFAWSGMFDLKRIAQFEKESGIRVNVSFYESNEELLVKMRATRGRGYDLIFPSDYAVNMLRQDNLLKQIEKNKCKFYSDLNPILLRHYFDPENNYSLPYEWSIFGLGVDTSFYNNKVPESSWSLIFNPYKMKTKVIMTNDPLLAIPIAAFYLYKEIPLFSNSVLQSIEDLLKAQKPYVEAYVDFRSNYYLASKNASVAVASSADIARIMSIYPTIDFIVPNEGSLVTIESFALSVRTKKDDLIYEFINFMYSPYILKRNFEDLGFFPPTMEPLSKINASPSLKKLLSLDKESFKQFSFFKINENPALEQKFYDLWIAVKS